MNGESPTAETWPFSARNPIAEAILKALYDALRSDQMSPNEPPSGVAVGALDLRRSAIFLATEANWHKWLEC